MKIFAVLSLVTLAVVASLFIGTEADNVTYGVIGRNSRLLEQIAVKVEYKLFRVVDEIVNFPQKGRVNYATLDAVQVVDYKKKNGGTPYLIKGGPGHRNATLRLKSDRGHGLDYKIYYYGN